MNFIGIVNSKRFNFSAFDFFLEKIRKRAWNLQFNMGKYGPNLMIR